MFCKNSILKYLVAITIVFIDFYKHKNVMINTRKTIPLAMRTTVKYQS